MLVCVLAYAGLRPSEALALTWNDLRERTLLVERALGADGAVRRTKTGQFRSVRLLAPLRDDLDAWSSQAGDGRLVSPTRRGVAWTEVAWRQPAPAGVRARGRGGRGCRCAAV